MSAPLFHLTFTPRSRSKVKKGGICHGGQLTAVELKFNHIFFLNQAILYGYSKNIVFKIMGNNDKFTLKIVFILLTYDHAGLTLAKNLL